MRLLTWPSTWSSSFRVSIETDEETGVSKVFVEECKNNQHSISFIVLGRSGPHISAESVSQRDWDP